MQPAGISSRQPSSFWLDPKGTKRSSPECARSLALPRSTRLWRQDKGRPETPCVRVAHFGQTVCPGQFTRPAARAPLPWPQTRRRKGAAAKPSYRLAVCSEPLEVRYLAVSCWGSAPFAPPALAPRQGRAPQARHPSSSARLFDRSERSECREFLAGPCLGARDGYSLATPRSERIRGLNFCLLLVQAKRRCGCRGAQPLRALGKGTRPGQAIKKNQE